MPCPGTNITLAASCRKVASFLSVNHSISNSLNCELLVDRYCVELSKVARTLGAPFQALQAKVYEPLVCALPAPCTYT